MKIKNLFEIYCYMTSETYRDLTLLKEIKKMNANFNDEPIMKNNDELEPITYNYNQNKKDSKFKTFMQVCLGIGLGFFIIYLFGAGFEF